MKSEWKDFLRNAGAEFVDDCIETFGNPERERRIAHTGDLFCDLSHFGIIAAYGEDATEFLQAQFTNDIKQVDEAHSQLSALCSPRVECCATSAYSGVNRLITWYCPTSCLKQY